MKLAGVIAVLSLQVATGCATTRGYERRLEAWVGKSKSALLAKWGEPSQVLRLDGGKEIVEYRRMNEEHTKVAPARQVAAEKKGAPPVGCRTQFLVGNDGQIERWKWVGDDCVAR